MFPSLSLQFIYRVSSLWLELGVSSIIVVGGCGDYFDVHNTAILVDNYVMSDATERAHSVSGPHALLVRFDYLGRVSGAGLLLPQVSGGGRMKEVFSRTFDRWFGYNATNSYVGAV